MRTLTDAEVDRRIHQYQRNGWSPVPYAHHPEHVRRAIRAARMRPKMKCCFENCIRLVLQQQEVKFTLCEGWVTTAATFFPIEHAWLKDEGGGIVDVTLGEARLVTVLLHREYDREQVRASVVKSRVFGQIDKKWFWENHSEAWAKLHRTNTTTDPVTTQPEGSAP